MFRIHRSRFLSPVTRRAQPAQHEVVLDDQRAQRGYVAHVAIQLQRVVQEPGDVVDGGPVIAAGPPAVQRRQDLVVVDVRLARVVAAYRVEAAEGFRGRRGYPDRVRPG